jgi:hypothetical protein
MSNQMKFRLMLALSAVMGYATVASAATPVPTVAQIAESHCVPGMTAATPGGCSLPGFHWAFTTESTGHNSYNDSVWMLLPNG